MERDCSEFGASTGERPTGSDAPPPLPPPLPPRPKTVWLSLIPLTTFYRPPSRWERTE